MIIPTSFAPITEEAKRVVEVDLKPEAKDDGVAVIETMSASEMAKN